MRHVIRLQVEEEEEEEEEAETEDFVVSVGFGSLLQEMLILQVKSQRKFPACLERHHMTQRLLRFSDCRRT